jgi:hypothetical protein
VTVSSAREGEVIADEHARAGRQADGERLIGGVPHPDGQLDAVESHGEGEIQDAEESVAVVRQPVAGPFDPEPGALHEADRGAQHIAVGDGEPGRGGFGRCDHLDRRTVHGAGTTMEHEIRH